MLWAVTPGRWYGWPDFHGSHPLSEGDRYKAPGKEPPKPLLAKYPNTPPEPVAVLGVHASADGLDFSRNPQFGYTGDAFIALFGDQSPETGKVLSPVGFKVVRVDVRNGIIEDFATNKGKTNGPASWLESGGLERPVAVKFDPGGTALYVVDFGVMTMSERGPAPQKETGVLWRVTRGSSAATK
jgi:glucose/arabinose dehydrogenase